MLVHLAMAHTVMVEVVTTYIVMAYMVMAYIEWPVHKVVDEGFGSICLF